MASVAPTGSDGFDQSFGMNSLSGDHGSKQGWTDVGSAARVQIHSVGWTDRYFVAILQTSTSSDYDTMQADSTRTARAVLAAEDGATHDAAPTTTDGDATNSTADTNPPAAAPPSGGTSPATSAPAPPTAALAPPVAAVPPTPSPAARLLAALQQVGRDIGAAVTAALGPLAGD
jgi:hypothetical protein